MNLSLLLIPGILAVFLFIVLLFQALWNSTFPALFGWKIISYWTAFKLLLISALLFGGYRLPFGYGTASTRTTDNGTVTTQWSLGSVQK